MAFYWRTFGFIDAIMPGKQSFAKRMLANVYTSAVSRRTELAEIHPDKQIEMSRLLISIRDYDTLTDEQPSFTAMLESIFDTGISYSNANAWKLWRYPTVFLAMFFELIVSGIRIGNLQANKWLNDELYGDGSIVYKFFVLLLYTSTITLQLVTDTFAFIAHSIIRMVDNFFYNPLLFTFILNVTAFCAVLASFFLAAPITLPLTFIIVGGSLLAGSLGVQLVEPFQNISFKGFKKKINSNDSSASYYTEENVTVNSNNNDDPIISNTASKKSSMISTRSNNDVPVTFIDDSNNQTINTTAAKQHGAADSSTDHTTTRPKLDLGENLRYLVGIPSITAVQFEKYLVENNAQLPAYINTQDVNGKSALSLAADNNRPDLSELLLKYGAHNINANCSNNITLVVN